MKTYNILTLDSVPPLDSQQLLERGAKPLEVGADLHDCDVTAVDLLEGGKKMNERPGLSTAGY